MGKKGIPKEVLEELDIGKREEVTKELEVTAVVERHQIKLPVPSQIRREIEIKKGQKIKIEYDAKRRIISYKL